MNEMGFASKYINNALLYTPITSTISLNPNKDTNYVLYTRCLNQDCLENLFCYFRQQHGNNLNPTPIEFSRSFKKIFCANYFKHSPGANCIEDLDEILGSELP